MTKLFDEYIPKAKAAFEEWAPKIMLVVNVLGAIAGAILWVGGVINNTSANIGLAIGYIVLWFNDAKNAIENFGYNAYNTMLRARDIVLRWAESVGLAIFGVINFFRTLPAQISSAIGGLGSLLYNSGRDLIQGLINGVRSMAGAVWQAIKDVTKDVIQTAKNMLGIKSPSIVFKGIGENIGKGMAQGIEASANLVQGSMVEMATPSQAQQAAQPTAVSRQNSTEINISLSGIFTGTPGEARKLAEMVADNLKTIAGSHNTTVTQMLGG
jgi:phage-related protein